jgi:uncharacterized protein (TIGR02284 family)
MAADSLKKLHTTLIDNCRGYQEAVKDAKDPASKALFSEMLTLKTNDHAELHRALLSIGERPDDSGSFMATVHETVIKVRSAVTGLGTNALPSFVMGEQQVIDEYKQAIADSSAYPATIEILNRQKAALQNKIAQMKTMET